MKRNRTDSTGARRVAALVLLLGLALLLAPQWFAQKLSLPFGGGTGLPAGLLVDESEGLPGRLAGSLRDSWTAQEGGTFQVLPAASSAESLDRLRKGTASAALVLPAPGVDTSGVSAVAAVGCEYVHLIAPADSKLASFRDLAGRKVGVGPEGGYAQSLAQAVFGFVLPFSPPELVTKHNAEVDVAFRNGEIDAMLIVSGLFDPKVEKLLGTGWYRLIPIPESEAIARYVPGLRAESLPPDLYGPDRSIPPRANGPCPTLAANVLLAVRATDASLAEALGRVVQSGEFANAARAAHRGDTPLFDVQPLALQAAVAPMAKGLVSQPTPDAALPRTVLLGAVLALLAGAFLLTRHAKATPGSPSSQLALYFDALAEATALVENATNPAELAAGLRRAAHAQREIERAWMAGGIPEGLMSQALQRCALYRLSALCKTLSPDWWDNDSGETRQEVPSTYTAPPAVAPAYAYEDPEDEPEIGPVRVVVRNTPAAPSVAAPPPEPPARPAAVPVEITVDDQQMPLF